MARKSKRGAHTSTTRKARRTIDMLEALDGVEAVIIGFSIGGKSIGRNASEGDFKIQREEEAGFKGVIQTSKGIQEIFIRIKQGQKEAFLSALEDKM
ncbi:MAG: hypothetical protein KTR29_21265 [Rhodothermaceae bacterium]|nr:hypothetical protein [Rhodothermaceae bacterium]